MINITRQEAITIMALEMQPLLLVSDDMYSADTKTVYNTLCGPLITLMCQFAFKMGTSLQLQTNPQSFQDFLRIINQAPPQFLLRQADTTILNFYNTNQALFKKIKYFSASNVIDYQALSYIAYKAYPGKEKQFNHISMLDSSLNLLIFTLLTVILISITLMIINKRISLMNFIIIASTLINVFFTSVDRISLVKGKITMKYILVLGPWFLAAFFITIVFINLILDNMERAIPNPVIDSWEDLESNKHVKIIAENVEFLVQFSKKSNSMMADKFRSRYQELKLEDVNNMTIMYGIANDLLTGRSAYVKNKLTIVYNMLYLQAICKLDHRLQDILHLSKYGGPDEQYFIIIPSTTSNHLADQFNTK